MLNDDEIKITKEMIVKENAYVEEFKAKAEIDKNASSAHKLLWKTFKVDKNGRTIYPDDYAGCWIERSKLHSKLHIALTSMKKLSC